LVVASIACSSLLSPCALVRAQVASTKSDDERRALELFKESENKYREGRFQDAVDLLLEAYRLHGASVLLYNLGRAYEGLGNLPSAIDSYTKYLERDAQAPDRKS